MGAHFATLPDPRQNHDDATNPSESKHWAISIGALVKVFWNTWSTYPGMPGQLNPVYAYKVQRYRFLGCTLWTDFRLFGDDDRPSAMMACEAVMVDYKRIRLAAKNYRKLRAVDTAQFHAAHKFWLKQKLAEPFDGKTIVITHMAPSMQSIADRYTTEPSSAAYASRIDELVRQADLWVHGHMHDSFDYQIGKCRVVCNPCGYKTRSGMPENTMFNPNLICEL